VMLCDWELALEDRCERGSSEQEERQEGHAGGKGLKTVVTHSFPSGLRSVVRCGLGATSLMQLLQILRWPLSHLVSNRQLPER
jgi:hypothetical protein